MPLNYYEDSWPLIVDTCPCDVHFLDYLAEHGIEGKVIFHFGSGEHHVLGVKNRELERPNQILAVTASPREHQAYVDLIIDDPVAARDYKVLFVDIYTLTAEILPRFDFVTLFHLCEFYDEEKSAYAQLDDAALVDLFLSKLNPEGRIFFYRGSTGFDRASPIIGDFVERGRMIQVDEHQTLLAYAGTSIAHGEPRGRP